MEQAMYIFGALRNRGKWKGDLVILANGGYGEFTDDELWQFERHGVIMKRIPTTPPIIADKYGFMSFFKQWDKVCLIAQDHVIYGDVKPLFEQEGDFFACEHGFCFDAIISDEFKEIGQREKLFVSDCVIYKTGILKNEDETVKEITETNERIKHFLKDEKRIDSTPELSRRDIGCYEAALNVHFHKIWQPLKGIEYIKFREDKGIVLEKNDGTIMAHTTHWHAPWNIEFPDGRIKYYHEQLEYFLDN
jgi:hypothetical protein